jgi:hypothetical protein
MDPICDVDTRLSTSNTVPGPVPVPVPVDEVSVPVSVYEVPVPVPVPRFVAVSEEDMEMRNKEAVPENTRKKVAWAVQILHDWKLCQSNQVFNKELAQITKDEMGHMLA